MNENAYMLSGEKNTASLCKLQQHFFENENETQYVMSASLTRA
jgi:hypothetical protein